MPDWKSGTLHAADGTRIETARLDPATPIAGALFVHGLGADLYEDHGIYRVVAEHLHERGIASLLFSFRAHGDSDGSTVDLSIAGQTLDLDAALRELEATTSAPRVLIAASFGALATLARRTRIEALCDGVVLLNPVLTVPPLPGAVEDAATWEGPNGMLLGTHLLRELAACTPDADFGQLTVPVLLMHGRDDRLVPCAASEAAVAARSRHTDFVVVDDAQHGFAGDEATALVVATITDWIAELVHEPAS